jgi:hypothetical protein
MSDSDRTAQTSPLGTWACDVCDDPVTADPSDGLVVWRSERTDTGIRLFDFKIVHKTNLGAPEPRRCDPDNAAGYWSSLDLQQLLGAEGLALLLSWLSAGPLKGGGSYLEIADMDEFVDFVRRVQTPYYEQARRRFGDEQTHHWLGDANEYYPYLPETLRRVADGTIGGRRS